MDAVDLFAGIFDAGCHECCPCGSVDMEDSGRAIVRLE
jgi:hypothetical protein